jgi:hypothetical protein
MPRSCLSVRPSLPDIKMAARVGNFYYGISGLYYLRLGYVVAQLVETLSYKRVRFPSVSSEFFNDIILPAALRPWSRISL